MGMDYDFVDDRRLSYEEAGVLIHVLRNISESATTEWLIGRTSAGRDKVRRIVSSLAQHGYIKVERTFGHPKVFIRGCLVSEWQLTGVKNDGDQTEKIESVKVETIEAEPRPIKQIPKQSASTVLKSSIELVETEVVEGELVEAIAETIVVKPAKKKITGYEHVKADPNFQMLATAYRQMLKSKNCRNNFGKVSSAAREYNKFIPLIEKEPALFALMMTGMSAYSAMCGRYPAGFSRYISERLWETALEEQEESTIDWEKIDDEIDGRDF